MFAISLWQPWAHLLVSGHKHFETRSWPMPSKYFRQPFAIHAAKKWDAELQGVCGRPHYRDFIPQTCRPLPLGAFVGIVTFGRSEQVNCWTMHLTEQELAFGDFSIGRWAWPATVMAVPQPIPSRGQQGIWSVKGEVGEQLESILQEIADASYAMQRQ